MLELSLSIAFALVVFAICFQLIQESTDRVNKGYAFQQFQQTAFQSLLRTQQLSQWHWADGVTPFNEISTSIPNESTINLQKFVLMNHQWQTSETSSDAIKVSIEHPRFTKKLSLYLTNYASIERLIGNLNKIKVALEKYYELNQIYPPHQQLNYLTQSNILTQLPNNPFTSEDLNQSHNKNITDWHYSNANGTITLFAYTHPNIQLNF